MASPVLAISIVGPVSHCTCLSFVFSFSAIGELSEEEITNSDLVEQALLELQKEIVCFSYLQSTMGHRYKICHCLRADLHKLLLFPFFNLATFFEI